MGSIPVVGFRAQAQLARNGALGRYPSGQRGLTVNQMAYAFGGSNPSLPTECDSSHRVEFESLAEARKLQGLGRSPRHALIAQG